MATVEEIAKAKALTLQNGKFINELVAGFAKDHGIENENLNYQISNMTMINNQQFDSFVDNNVVSNAELEQTDKVEQLQEVGKIEKIQQQVDENNLNQINVGEPDNVDEHVSESENKNEFTGETTINEVGESIRPQNADAKNENENSNEFVGETTINEFGEIVRPQNGGTSATLNSGLNENIPVFIPPERKEDLEHQVDKSDEPDITVGSYIRDNIKQELLGKKRQDEDELGKGK